MQKIENFKKALIKGEVVFILNHLSKSGIQRSFKVLYYHKKQFLPIPLKLAKKIGDGLDKNTKAIKIKGAGMDMSFLLYKRILTYFKFNIKELGQNYKSYVSYEEFLSFNKHMKKIIELKN